MPASASSEAGRARGHLGQRGVVEDDVGGQVVLARDLGAPGLQAAKRALRLRRRAAAAAACRRVAARAPRALAPCALRARAATRSSSGTSPRSTARALSVSASVCTRPRCARGRARSAGAARARHCASLRSAPMPKVLSRSWPYCATLSVRLAAQHVDQVAGAEALAAVLVEAVDAATAPCAPPRWRPRSAGGCRQLSQLPQRRTAAASPK